MVITYTINMRYKINEILKEKQITVYHFSKQEKIDMRTLSRIVNNKVKGCNNETLDKIARALDVTIDELFDRKDHS